MSRRIWNLFRFQRNHAVLRGIGWDLTFEEWIQIWLNSGHFEDRGRRRAQYCMARLGDVGRYQVNNVKIITNLENCQENVIRNSSYEKMKGIKNPMSLANVSSVKRRAKLSEYAKTRIGDKSAVRIGAMRRNKEHAAFVLMNCIGY